MYNIFICGSAGDGIETMSFLLERMLKRSGYYVFTMRDAMSRVRGGQNFTQIRFSNQPIYGHQYECDCMFFTNEEAFELHKGRLKKDGVAICDSRFQIEDERVIALDLMTSAKELGNARVYGSIGLGAILKLFGIGIANTSDSLSSAINASILDINVKAIEKGYQLVNQKIDIVKANELNKNDILITGSQALVWGALAADLTFYAAYPMSPATSMLTHLEDYSNEFDLVVEQVEDEIAAVNMAIGAAFTGSRAMTGSSGGGFALMVEALGLAGIAEIPIVIVDVQRPGPATGLPTRTEQSDLRFVISASQGEFPRMVIALRDHEDAFYQTARAFELAEKYRIPVLILSDQYLADSSATIPACDVSKVFKANLFSDTNQNTDKPYLVTESGVSPRMIPGVSDHPVRSDSDEHDEYGVITESAEVRNQMVEKRMRKFEHLKEELIEPTFIGSHDFDTLFVGFGSTTGALKEAVAKLNENSNRYAALAFGDVWPLPTKSLEKYAKQAKTIINVEQNATGQLASLIHEVSNIRCHESILKYDGRQIGAYDIVNAVERRTGHGQ